MLENGGEQPVTNTEEEALSTMFKADGGWNRDSKEDLQAHEDLLVELRQKQAEAKGELVDPTEVEPIDVEGAMAVHSESWHNEEK